MGNWIPPGISQILYKWISAHALSVAFCQEMSLFLEGTLGHDVGPGSDGVHLGTITASAATLFLTKDNTVYVDDTTDFNDAGANDVAVWPATPVADEDAIYFGGGTSKFCGIMVNFGTAAADLVMTTKPQFWNGTAWTDIAATAYEDNTALMQSAATGNKLFSFTPPATWAANTALNGPDSNTGYFIRFLVSAYTSKTTMPLITQGWLLLLSAGTGFKAAVTGTLDLVEGSASTLSGSTGDSLFLIVNLTKGTHVVFTMTKAVAFVSQVVSLAVTKDDAIAVKQVIEDGSTEFADLLLICRITPS